MLATATGLSYTRVPFYPTCRAHFHPACAGDATKKMVAAIVADGLVPLVLGGDHSITYPVLEGITEARLMAQATKDLEAWSADADQGLEQPSDGVDSDGTVSQILDEEALPRLWVIHFDAHSDLYEAFPPPPEVPNVRWRCVSGSVRPLCGS